MRETRAFAGLVVLITVFAACRPATPADPEVLMEADREFNRTVQEGGADTWTSWFATDGSLIAEGEGEIRGHAALRNRAEFLNDPDLSLTWEPTRAEIAGSGDLGWTTGTYEFTVAGEGGESVTRGLYVSIWGLQPDGSWKVVMDLGVPVDQPAP